MKDIRFDLIKSAPSFYSGKKKGISLAIETIVVLVISIAVLFALLGLFQHFFGPAQPQLDATKMRIDKCGEYARVYPVAQCFDDRNAIKIGASTIFDDKTLKTACAIKECVSLTKLCIAKCCGDSGFCAYKPTQLG